MNFNYVTDLKLNQQKCTPFDLAMSPWLCLSLAFVSLASVESAENSELSDGQVKWRLDG